MRYYSGTMSEYPYRGTRPAWTTFFQNPREGILISTWMQFGKYNHQVWVQLSESSEMSYLTFEEVEINGESLRKRRAS